MVIPYSPNFNTTDFFFFFNSKVSVEIYQSGKGTFFAFQIHHWFEEAAKIITFVSSKDLNFLSQIFIYMCSMK